MGDSFIRLPVFRSAPAAPALLAAAALLLSLAGGCRASRDETVRERDRQRQEIARTMPGNDLPQDPADLGDRAPTDPALDQDSR